MGPYRHYVLTTPEASEEAARRLREHGIEPDVIVDPRYHKGALLTWVSDELHVDLDFLRPDIIPPHFPEGALPSDRLAPHRVNEVVA